MCLFPGRVVTSRTQVIGERRIEGACGRDDAKEVKEEAERWLMEKEREENIEGFRQRKKKGRKVRKETLLLHTMFDPFIAET